MTDIDPTKLDLEISEESDPRIQRIHGYTYHGNHVIDVPVITHIEGNLWQGGCKNGLILPNDIRHLVSLYKWESYATPGGLDSEALVVEAFDNTDQDTEVFVDTALKAYEKVLEGPTLIHCQAGLNRSGVVSGLVLILLGHSPREAVELLRETRGPAVLCNPKFSDFVEGIDADELRHML